MRRLLLGVNIDHVATLREARRVAYPDPVEAARFAERGGADGITDHRRAVQSYAVGRGLDITWTEGSAVLGAPGQSLNIDFDGLGRVDKITGTVAPSDLSRA